MTAAQKATLRHRFTTVTLLAATGAALLSVLAGPAVADPTTVPAPPPTVPFADNYLAISYSMYDQKWGVGRSRDQNIAVERSMDECYGALGERCVLVAVEKEQCLAVSAFQQDFAVGRGPTKNDALQSAAHALARSNVLIATCS